MNNDRWGHVKNNGTKACFARATQWAVVKGAGNNTKILHNFATKFLALFQLDENPARFFLRSEMSKIFLML